jgi:hypothetical protein
MEENIVAIGIAETKTAEGKKRAPTVNWKEENGLNILKGSG